MFDLSHYLVELIPAALTGFMVWSGKRILGQFEAALSELKAEVKELAASRHIHDTAKALLEQRICTLEHQMEKLVGRFERSPSGNFPVVPP